VLEYDLIRLNEHGFPFWDLVPYAIVTFGGSTVGQYLLEIEWKISQNEQPKSDQLLLIWDTMLLKAELPRIEEYLTIIGAEDEDQATRIMRAAVVVTAAMMRVVQPEQKITRRSGTGTRHDYYLNETRDEMVEVKGRSKGSLSGLFEEAKMQSEQNPTLRKRWVSVTVFSEPPRNRTEGLHQ
jgi:hypothetical protein